MIADGYRYNMVARWGDSLFKGTRDFDSRRLYADDWLDADAVDAQERQFGTNADAVAVFSVAPGPRRARPGLREPRVRQRANSCGPGIAASA